MPHSSWTARGPGEGVPIVWADSPFTAVVSHDVPGQALFQPVYTLDPLSNQRVNSPTVAILATSFGIGLTER